MSGGLRLVRPLAAISEVTPRRISSARVHRCTCPVGVGGDEPAPHRERRPGRRRRGLAPGGTARVRSPCQRVSGRDAYSRNRAATIGREADGTHRVPVTFQAVQLAFAFQVEEIDEAALCAGEGPATVAGKGPRSGPNPKAAQGDGPVCLIAHPSRRWPHRRPRSPCRPSVANATAMITSLCPSRRRTSLPVSTSHRRSVLSRPPERSLRTIWEIAALLQLGLSGEAPDLFTSLGVPEANGASLPPVTTRRPSAEKATP